MKASCISLFSIQQAIPFKPLRLPDITIMYQLPDVTLLLQHQPAGSIGAPAHRAARGQFSSVPQKPAASATGESHSQAEGTSSSWGWVPVSRCSSWVQSLCCSQGIVLHICALKPLFGTGSQGPQRLLGRRACLLEPCTAMPAVPVLVAMAAAAAVAISSPLSSCAAAEAAGAR